MKFILSRVVFIVRIIFRGIFENTIRAAETWTPPPIHLGQGARQSCVMKLNKPKMPH